MSARPSTAALPDIAIIGHGNWGASLARGLLDKRIPLREVVIRRGSARPTSRLPLSSWSAARLDAKILWLCVPDRAVAEVAAELAARRTLRGQIVVHSSGVLTVQALDAARRAGALVAAVHPVMTFPTRKPVPLGGVLFGIEAPSVAARRTLDALVRCLGGHPFRIQRSRKPLYHAAGTLSSPLLVSALTAAIETARAAGLGQREAIALVQALSQATLANVFARGPRNSFSGPFARGDAATVKLHLQALAGHPILADVYRSLARHALRSLPVRNERELASALAGPTAQGSSSQPGTTKAKRVRNLTAGS